MHADDRRHPAGGTARAGDPPDGLVEDASGSHCRPPHCSGCSSLKKPTSSSSVTVSSGRRRSSSAAWARLAIRGSRSSMPAENRLHVTLFNGRHWICLPET